MWNLENDTVNLFAKQKQRHIEGKKSMNTKGQERDKFRDWD